jgi:hypothetical protein
METVENKIREVKNYVDGRGFEVRHFIDIFTDGNSRENFMQGFVKFEIQTGDPRMPTVPKMVGFVFPTDVTDVKKAFEVFEEHLETAMKEEQEIARKQQEEEEKKRFAASKEIMPVGNGKQLVVPFPGRG